MSRDHRLFYMTIPGYGLGHVTTFEQQIRPFFQASASPVRIPAISTSVPLLRRTNLESLHRVQQLTPTTKTKRHT